MASLHGSLYYEAAMVLSAAGDALGYKNGFWKYNNNGKDILKELKSLGGLSALNVKQPTWMISEGAVMHLATAEALTEKSEKNCDKGELHKMIARKYKACMKDMGGRATDMTNIEQVCDLKPKRRNWEDGCRIIFNERGWGCGAAIRAMCIGLRYPWKEDLLDLITVSIESGRMTHHHPTGYLGSLASALFTAYAIQGKPPREWGAGLISVLPLAKEYIISQEFYVDENLQNWDYFEHCWRKYLKKKQLLDGTKDPRPDSLKVDERDRFYKKLSFSGLGGASGYDVPMIAYDAILQSGKNWEVLCRRAMFHGGDGDCTGVIAACWYGAMYGYEGVPQGNYKNIEYFDKMVEQGKLLYELAHGLSIECMKEKVPEENYEAKLKKTDMRFAQVAVSYMGPNFKEPSSWSPNSGDIAVQEANEPFHPKYMYNMNHPNRGKALIISNKNFDKKELKDRRGTDEDSSALSDCLSELGFEVTLHNNKTAKEMKDKVQKAAESDHKDNDCFVLAILSHGGDGYVWGTDEMISITVFIDLLKGDKCISLAKKPKLFFIQACRGRTLDEGVEIDSCMEVSPKISLEKTPSMAEFLIAYSTVSGYASVRHPNYGSWFIQALVKALKKHGQTKDMLSIMTIVNQKIAKKMTISSEPSLSQKKQMSCFQSTMTKLLYFTGKKREPQRRDGGVSE